eukprot:1107530-Amorphochlora_amoeboformis.AAC.1
MRERAIERRTRGEWKEKKRMESYLVMNKIQLVFSIFKLCLNQFLYPSIEIHLRLIVSLPQKNVVRRIRIRLRLGVAVERLDANGTDAWGVYRVD